MNYNDFEDTIDLGEIQEELNSKKLIKNEQLERYIKFYKAKSVLEKRDLEDIKEIILDSKDEIGRRNFVEFEEILLFPNLKKLKLYNLGIYEKEIELINDKTNIEELYFENCGLSNLNKLEKIKKLHICSSKLDDFDEIIKMNLLEELKIENINIYDYEFLDKVTTLKKLYLLDVNENAIDLLPELKNIEFLSIRGIECACKEKIAKFSNLKELEINKSEMEKYAELIEELEKSEIKISVEDNYEYI